MLLEKKIFLSAGTQTLLENIGAILLNCPTQGVVSGPAASASPGSLLQMQISWLHPSPTESKSGSWARNLFEQAPQGMTMMLRLENLCISAASRIKEFSDENPKNF